ncbi:MAG: hypothetical protein JWO99_398 [Candidatus Saccharibacteria bacterium]|nr:hypothetical protein [Candidatus Saccharibacteria bacterium]
MPRPPQTNHLITSEQVLSFRDASRRQIESWPGDIPDYTSVAGSQPVYAQMGNLYTERMLADGLDPRFRSTGSTGGLSIIPRFLYAGAAKAAVLGYELADLKDGMYNHGTLESLSNLTVDENDVVVALEIELGLRPGGVKSIDESLDHYTFDPENGLGFTNFDRARRTAHMDAYIRHGKSYEFRTELESRCEGQRTGVLAIAYRAMLMISLSDPNLFQATLEAKESTEDDAA